MADLAKIVEDLSKLTVLEAAELSKLLEEKWGVSAAAPVAMAMPSGGGAAPAEAVEEQTESPRPAGRRRQEDTIRSKRRTFGPGLRKQGLGEGASRTVENVSKQNPTKSARRDGKTAPRAGKVRTDRPGQFLDGTEQSPARIWEKVGRAPLPPGEGGNNGAWRENVGNRSRVPAIRTSRG